jgi:hypothetical protein
MEFNPNPQQIPHQHNSTTVWTQPATEEQRRYYSKHAAEKRVFGWITTLLQTAHGAIAFAAWTAIYLWVFKAVPFMLPTAPFIAGATLLALHILFRTTWQTFWYDKLDKDPNTDSPIWVPVAIFILLITLEVQGAKQYLAGQVAPVAEKGTTQIDSEHSTTLASIEQAYRNQVGSINEVYKAKTAPVERQIASARNRSADTDQERRARSARIAALQSQRDAILAEKAEQLKKALDEAADSRSKATARREQAVAGIDTHNAGELARYTAEMGSVGTYAWVLSLGLLFLIAGLSYRTVRINVKSGIIPLRNYTILDAHGSLPERIWTALTDAINRRGLQFAVWMHRLLSPKQAITSFDGTVVARPGTYNTPAGFYNPENPLNSDSDDALRAKVADKLLREAARGEIRLTPELLELELQKARTMNGSYASSPLGKHEPSPATARPAEGPTVALHPAGRNSVNSENSENSDPDGQARWIKYLRDTMLAHIQAYDRAIAADNRSLADTHQRAISEPGEPLPRLMRRLRLSAGIEGGQILLWRDATPHIKVPLGNLTPAALDGQTSTAEAAADDELFKQNPNLFKQKIVAHTDADGKVIGIKYQKKDGNWTTYDYNTVRGQWGIYQRRAAKGEISDAVRDGLEKWEYAMSLFEQGREELRENLQIITH